MVLHPPLLAGSADDAAPIYGGAVCRPPKGIPGMPVEPTHDPLNRLLTDADALADCLYVLRRWRFAVSAQGFVWVRPESVRPSVASLAGFISLVERCCDENFPAGMLFDFSRGRIDGEEWTQAFGLLQDLADQLGARWRVIRPAGCGATGILIYRDSRREELRAARHRAKSLGLTCFAESDISD
jgi:hypothetical protein